ncbi:MAG: hypothetical protein R3E89_17970 [Thiolinea sp.]
MSTALVLLLTAEVWHLALTQTLAKTGLLLMLALLLTTTFVTIRQRLFVQRALHTRSEQSVITNVSAAAIVFLGMLTTALLLLLACLLFTHVLYQPALIQAWATLEQTIAFSHYLQTSLFVTVLGLVIGALGASFEDQYYFRHIVFVDEET